MFTPIPVEDINKYLTIGNPVDNPTASQWFAECAPSVCSQYKAWGWKGHNGIDLPVPEGTPCKAVFDGVCTSSGADNAGGIFVNIQSKPFSHKGQKFVIEARYYHLSRFDVKAGENVSKGQILALSGNTGFSTGAHLHFGIKIRYELIPAQGGVPAQYVADYQNGYSGAVDPAPLFEDRSWLKDTEDPFNIINYEGKLIKGTSSPKVYKVLGLTRHHIKDEEMFWLWGHSLDKDIIVVTPYIISKIPEAEKLTEPNGVNMSVKQMKQILYEARRKGL